MPFRDIVKTGALNCSGGLPYLRGCSITKAFLVSTILCEKVEEGYLKRSGNRFRVGESLFIRNGFPFGFEQGITP